METEFMDSTLTKKTLPNQKMNAKFAQIVFHQCDQGGQDQAYFSHDTHVGLCSVLHITREILIELLLACTLPSQPGGMRRMMVKCSQFSA